MVDQGERVRKLVEMVRLDRHCEAWYPYRPGFDPKEHYEELQMQRLEQDRRAFEKSLSELALAVQRDSALIAEKNAVILEHNVEISKAARIW